MKTYCLIFKPLSVISRIPDAQTIFGAICNIILNTQGEEKFNQYIDSFKQNRPWLVHSSMFPAGQFPMVNHNLFSTDYVHQHILQQSADRQLDYLQKMKKYKKIQWMSNRVYDQYVLTNQIEQLRKDLLSEKLVVEKNDLRKKGEEKTGNMLVQLNTHVQKTQLKNLFKDKDNDLYYDEVIYCDDQVHFCIYIKTLLNEDQIKAIFQYTHVFGIGERHSVGKNSFQFINMIQMKQSASSDYRMLLSKSTLDDAFSLSNSYYSIDSNVQRTSKYYLNNRIVGRFNLLKEGSFMKVKQSKEWYGELIDQVYEGQHLYHYAIGFTL